MTLSDVRKKLVEAHKRQDWEQAKILSQLKQQLRQRRYCQWPGCGVRITRPKNSPGLHCAMHARAVRYYGRMLPEMVL